MANKDTVGLISAVQDLTKAIEGGIPKCDCPSPDKIEEDLRGTKAWYAVGCCPVHGDWQYLRD